MGLQVNWRDASKTIILYHLDGKWDWNDFEDMLEKGFEMTEGVSHTVHAILHFTESSVLPDGAIVMWKRLMTVLPANQGKVAFVNGSKSVKTAVKMFVNVNKAFRHQIIVADSLNLVYQILEQQFPDLITILVIEDESALREEIIDMLNLEGYRTLEANNGVTGLQLAIEFLPSIILCDISMPQMGGFDVLDALRRNEATVSIPFIFLTAKADRSFMRHGMELGADDYLTKPFTNSELLTAIKVRLERRTVTTQSVPKVE